MTVKRKLAPKERQTSPASTRFSLHGGMMTARNIPYRATLSELTRIGGSVLPAETPRNVPTAQPGAAARIIP